MAVIEVRFAARSILLDCEFDADGAALRAGTHHQPIFGRVVADTPDGYATIHESTYVLPSAIEEIRPYTPEHEPRAGQIKNSPEEGA